MAMLAGCMETMPRPEPAKPIACPQNFAPVCAAKGLQRRTFSNACLARAETYRVIRQQPCEGNTTQ